MQLAADYTLQQVLIPTDPGYETVDVQISNGRIAAIAPHLPVQGTAVAGQRKLLLPGFVNAHTHSPEMWQRGLVSPLPLELWLAQLHEFRPLDPEEVYLSALGTAVETLLTGGTTVVDHLALMPGKEIETIAAAVRAYREIGIRAFVAPLIHDQPLAQGIPTAGQKVDFAPPPLSTETILELLHASVKAFHRPEEGIQIMTAPTGIQLVTDALFVGCVEISNQFDLCRHAHLLETKSQQILAHEKYGISAVEHLQKLGFLNDHTSLAHCVWLTDNDIEILATTGSTVVHNPLSNLRLGSGIAPLLKYLKAGVNVSFGCDGSASNDSQDLLEAIKIGSILHNITDFEYRSWIPPRQSITMASLGGAKGLGLDDRIGSLTVGKEADLVLYDLTSLSLLPQTDPIGLLILGRPTQVVDSVWVKGRRVVADGEVTTTSVSQLRQQLWERSSRDPVRQSEAVRQSEIRYRAVMGLPE